MAGWTLIEGNYNDEEANDVSSADAVLVQREYSLFHSNFRAIIRNCARFGKPLIWEVDDLLVDLPRNHNAYYFFERSKHLMLEVLAAADAVIVSTEQLKQQLAGWSNNIHVVSNYIDDRLWSLSPPRAERNDVVTIGYCALSSHRQDIDSLAYVLARLLDKYGQRLRIGFIGIAPPEPLQVMPGIYWRPCDIGSYQQFVGYMSTHQSDIAIAPLVDHPFNRCKSAIKFMEYSALGIPMVCSHLPPYASIVQQGETGFLASSPADWEYFLSQLIEDADLRISMAARAQDYVRNNLLLSGNKTLLSNTYDKIIASAQAAMQRKAEERSTLQVAI